MEDKHHTVNNVVDGAGIFFVLKFIGVQGDPCWPKLLSLKLNETSLIKVSMKPHAITVFVISHARDRQTYR
jgi:hypothetical protein